MLDVALCLLLVGVAVGTLALAVPDDGQSMAVDSDADAKTVATVTATVSTDAESESHATLAQHLVQAAIVNATLDGAELTTSKYPDEVRRAVGANVDERVQVTASWEPYHDSVLRSRISVGDTPPSTADTAATRMTVESGVTPRDPDGTFESVAESIAKAYVYRLFPPERTRVRLVDPRTAPATADRYRATARSIDVDIESPLAEASAERVNLKLVAALANSLEDDLRNKYGRVEAVPSGTDTREVEIVVRRWEP